MKTLIAMPAEHYDLFVAECDITSREYSILKNGLVLRTDNSGEKRAIEILCDKEEAERLLDAANRLYPKAVPAIEARLDLANEP